MAKIEDRILQIPGEHCQRHRFSGVAWFSSILLLTLSVAVHTQSTTGTSSNGLVYLSSGTSVTITGYSGTGSVIVPGIINEGSAPD